MTLWVIRILFLALCTVAGFAVSQVRPELVHYGWAGALIGFGFGWLMIAVDEMLKGFSLRAFSATTFGLLLGNVVALLIDNSGLFDHTDAPVRWLIRLGLFLSFSYVGIILAMRSNKEDFSLVIPYVRFSRENKPDNLLLLDTSAIIDGRIADLIDANFVEGIIVVPRFVLRELQQIADSNDPVKRARGRRGLEMLNRLRQNTRNEVKIHEGDPAGETEVDAKLVQLARSLKAKLFTNDYNLAKIAELQSVQCVNLHELARSLRTTLLPGEVVSLRIVREGRDKGQGVGYLPDGTMVVVNNGQSAIGRQVDVQIQSSLQTGAGVIVFADLKEPPHTESTAAS
ncbi:MAG TPA: TRAM domain-containing protein [Verrucomicrobia bacterium]|nr:TRAM domain-containing protein [Verrucomicrobiota bacterium]HOP98062.1 TRAM domain-containing protein [Verrucomicrobiota bacterium]HPU57449.1 TRAM domain-containing protein [Verrucomicrobiota bacterium]